MSLWIIPYWFQTLCVLLVKIDFDLLLQMIDEMGMWSMPTAFNLLFLFRLPQVETCGYDVNHG